MQLQNSFINISGCLGVKGVLNSDGSAHPSWMESTLLSLKERDLALSLCAGQADGISDCSDWWLFSPARF